MGWDVPSNLFIVVYSLLRCAGNFDDSILTAVSFGEDTDCTAGTIAALYGLMHGVDCIDKKWIEPIGRGIKTISLDPLPPGRPHPRHHRRDERARGEALPRRKEQFDLDIQFEPEGARPAPDFTAPPYFQKL